MRTLHSFATVCVFGAVAALLPACGSTDEPSTGGTAGASTAGAPGAAGASTAGAPGTAGASTAGAPGAAGAPAGDPAKGATVFNSFVCGSCHGADAKGLTGPNITASATAGTGAWTYQQFHDTLRTNINKDGRQLCAFMSKYEVTDISESSMADLWAYLRSLPVSDVANKGTSCP